MKKPRKLTAKQNAYLNNRIKGYGVSESYRKAYPGQKTSTKAISVAANKLEKDTRISLAIDIAREKAIGRSIMSRQEALQRLSKHARVKITDVCDFSFQQIGVNELNQPVYQTVWTIKDSDDIDPEVAVCIKSVSITKEGPKIELHDSDGAIKQLRAMEGWDAPKKTELKSENNTTINIPTKEQVKAWEKTINDEV